MAPRPLISPRCHNCRRRKIKCDYQHPECRRCLASGQKCEGYENNLTFIIYGDSSSRAESSPPGPSSTSPSPPPPTGAQNAQQQPQQRTSRIPFRNVRSSSSLYSSFSSPSSPTEVAALVTSSIPPSLSPPAETLAGPYFLHLFSSPCPRGGTARNLGSLAFLPRMMADSPGSQPFRVVQSEVVRVCKANQGLGEPMTDVQRVGAYQRCVEAVRRALVSPSHRAEEATVGAIWLLGIFELVNGSPPGNEPSSGTKDVPHTWSLQCQGLEAVIKMRGYKKAGSDTLDDTFWTIFAPVQCRYLITDEPIPAIFTQWLDEMSQQQHPSPSLALAAAKFTSSAASIVAQIIPVLRFGTPNDADDLLPKVMHQIRDAQLHLDRAVPRSDASALAELAFHDPYVTNALSLAWGAGMKAHHYIAALCTSIRDCRLASAQEGSEADAWAELAWGERCESLRSMHRMSRETLDHAALVLRPLPQQAGSGGTVAGALAGHGSWILCLRLFLPLALTARLPTSCPALKREAVQHIRYISQSGIRQTRWYKNGFRPYNLQVDTHWTSEICSC